MQYYRAGVIAGVNKIEFYQLVRTKPQHNQVLIRVTHCAICTLEQRIYSGTIHRYPFAGGHEVSGIVEEVGPDVQYIKPGEKVVVRFLNTCGECYYCRSGHENLCETAFKASTHPNLNGPGGLSEYIAVDAMNVYKLPQEVDLAQAALAEPLACCIHSVRKADIRLGEDVAVIGIGIMGALHIQLAKMKGARIIACEMDPDRLEMARRLGADVLINSSEENAKDRILNVTEGRGADVVFCTAAQPSVAEESVQIAGKVGRVVLYSSFHPDEPISLNVNRIHSTEIEITGSINPNISDFLTASRLMARGLIDVSKLITEIVPFEEMDSAFKKAIDPTPYRIVVQCT